MTGPCSRGSSLLPLHLPSLCLSFFSLLFVACGTVYPGPPECIVGSGVYGFVPFDRGSSIPIIHGVQGGFHIWGSALARYMTAGQATLRFTLTLDADRSIASQVRVSSDFTTVDPATLPDAGSASAVARADGWNELLGSRVFVLDPARIDGQPLHMKLEIADSEGRNCTDERGFTPHLNP